MGMAKKDVERQEAEQMQSEQCCIRCGRKLTKDEIEYNENWGTKDLCSDCRSTWEAIQKE